MPIEIKELHIKAIITNRDKETNSGASFKQEDINKLKKKLQKK